MPLARPAFFYRQRWLSFTFSDAILAPKRRVEPMLRLTHCHARPCAGHPRLNFDQGKGVDGREICAKTRFALVPGHGD